MPAAVEVMATTPTSQSAMDSANADKKRNKLGYHRTSVACGEYLDLFFLSSHGLSIYRLCYLFPLLCCDT